jgi:hypothetical protein
LLVKHAQLCRCRRGLSFLSRKSIRETLSTRLGACVGWEGVSTSSILVRTLHIEDKQKCCRALLHVRGVLCAVYIVNVGPVSMRQRAVWISPVVSCALRRGGGRGREPRRRVASAVGRVCAPRGARRPGAGAHEVRTARTGREGRPCHGGWISGWSVGSADGPDAESVPMYYSNGNAQRSHERSVSRSRVGGYTNKQTNKQSRSIYMTLGGEVGA